MVISGRSTEQMATCQKNEEILGIEAAAKFLGVHHNTVRRWANKGKLRFYLDRNGWRKFSMDDLIAFKKELERLT